MISEPFDQQIAEQVDAYVERLFVPPDATLTAALEATAAAGMPAISVSPNQGKLIHLLTRMVRAERVLEVGTLGGYSTIWLARALPPHGRVVSLELEARNAEVARGNVARAGVGDRVEVRVGPAADSMRAMIAAGEAPFDVVFIDANKDGYPEYLSLALQLTRPGSLLLADNVVRGGRVVDPQCEDPLVQGVQQFARDLAANPHLESLIIPVMRERFDGMSITIVQG